MKYIKTYEYNTLNYNDVYKFLKRIVKLFGKEYSVHLTQTNTIQILYKESEIFTEIISNILFQPNLLIFEIYNPYNPKYELNVKLVEYFNIVMEKIYEKDYTYSFRYNSKTKLKIKDFKTLMNTIKYNL